MKLKKDVQFCTNILKMLADSLSSITIHDKSIFVNFPGQHDFIADKVMTNGILGMSNSSILGHEIINNFTWTGIILILLMFIVSSIWYFAPSIIKSNFTSLFQNPLKRIWETNSNSAGLFINALLYLNFLVVTPLVLIKTFQLFGPGNFLKLGLIDNMLIINLLLFGFIVFRLFFVWSTALIYDTTNMGKAHNKMLNNIEKAFGIIILPLIFVSTYISASWIMWLNAFILGLFILSRWIFTMVIGIRITKFSWSHIILYLCTLEIIPILLAIKLIEKVVF